MHQASGSWTGPGRSGAWSGRGTLPGLPVPNIILKAARRLGVPPQQCRAHEDTELGLAAIRAAGMDAVDVRTRLPAPTF